MAQGTVGLEHPRGAARASGPTSSYNLIWILALPSLIGILGLVLYPPDQFESLLGSDPYQLMPVFLSTSTSRRGCW